MPDIALDYDKIEQTSSRLDSAVETIVPMLNDLKNDVSTLTEDGMVFRQSSPAIREAYDKFNTSLVAAMDGIKNFATQFRRIKSEMEKTDTEIAKNFRSSG
jgi:uncharacterized protein YukE